MSNYNTLSSLLHRVNKTTYSLPTQYSAIQYNLEDIKTIALSNYTCGTPVYNYGSCTGISGVGQVQFGTINNYQNYINITPGFESVACNVPSNIYRLCGAFRLKNRGAYLYRDSSSTNPNQLIFKTPDDSIFNTTNITNLTAAINATRFIIETDINNFYLKHVDTGLYLNIDINGNAVLSTTKLSILAYDINNNLITGKLGFDLQLKFRLQSPDNRFFTASQITGTFTPNNTQLVANTTNANFYFDQESEFDKLQYYGNITSRYSVANNNMIYSLDCSTDGTFVAALVYNTSTSTSNILLNTTSGTGTWTAVQSFTGVTNTNGSIAMSWDGTYISAIINGRILISQNKGVSWFNPLGAQMSINSTNNNWREIAMSKDGRIQIVALNNTLLTSLDFGANWYNLSATTFPNNITAFSCSYDGTFQVVITSTNAYLSTDGGYKFNSLTIPTPPLPDIIGTLINTKLSGNGSIILISTTTGIFRNTNYGRTDSWQYVPKINNIIDMSISSTGMIVTLLQNNGLIYTSFNYGQSYSELYTGLIQTTTLKNNENRNWSSICMSINGTNQYFATNGNNGFISNCTFVRANTDEELLNIAYNAPVTSSYNYDTSLANIATSGSTNWIQVDSSENGGCRVVISSTGRIIILRSGVNDSFGNPVYNDMSIPTNVVDRNWTSLSVSRNDASSILLTERKGLIYRLSNFGSTWSILYNKITDFSTSGAYWSSIAQSANGRFITAAAFNDCLYSYINNNWIQLTATSVNNPNPFPLISKWVSVTMSSSGQNQTAVIYNGPIYISSSFGNNWIANSLVKNWCSVAISADGKTQLAATEDEYVYISRDFGYTWNAILDKTLTDVTRGIRTPIPDTRFTSCEVSSDGNIMTVTANNNNIYISYDSGFSWNIYGFINKSSIEPPFLISNQLNITSNLLDPGSNLNYIASASSNNTNAFRVFDGYSNTSWSSTTNYTNGAFNKTTPTTNNYAGEHVQIKLMYRTRVNNMVLTPDNNNFATDSPIDFKLFGSNDGTSWIELIASTTLTYTSNVPVLVSVNSNNFYQNFRLVVNKVNGGIKLSIGNLLFIGTTQIKITNQTVFDTINTWRSASLYNNGMNQIVINNNNIYQTNINSSFGRYIYLVGSNNTRSLGVNEIEIFDKNYKRISFQSVTSNVPEITSGSILRLYSYINDGNYSNNFVVDNYTTIPFIKIDLGTNYDIGEINVYSSSNQINNNYLQINFATSNNTEITTYQSSLITSGTYTDSNLTLYSFVPPLKDLTNINLPISLPYSPSTNSLIPSAPSVSVNDLTFTISYLDQNALLAADPILNVLVLIPKNDISSIPSEYYLFNLSVDGYLYNFGCKLYLDNKNIQIPTQNIGDSGLSNTGIRFTGTKSNNKFSITKDGRILSLENNLYICQAWSGSIYPPTTKLFMVLRNFTLPIWTSVNIYYRIYYYHFNYKICSPNNQIVLASSELYLQDTNYLPNNTINWKNQTWGDLSFNYNNLNNLVENFNYSQQSSFVSIATTYQNNQQIWVAVGDTKNYSIQVSTNGIDWNNISLRTYDPGSQFVYSGYNFTTFLGSTGRFYAICNYPKTLTTQTLNFAYSDILNVNNWYLGSLTTSDSVSLFEIFPYFSSTDVKIRYQNIDTNGNIILFFNGNYNTVAQTFSLYRYDGNTAGSVTTIQSNLMLIRRQTSPWVENIIGWVQTSAIKFIEGLNVWIVIAVNYNNGEFKIVELNFDGSIVNRTINSTATNSTTNFRTIMTNFANNSFPWGITVFNFKHLTFDSSNRPTSTIYFLAGYRRVDPSNPKNSVAFLYYTYDFITWTELTLVGIYFSSISCIKVINDVIYMFGTDLAPNLGCGVSFYLTSINGINWTQNLFKDNRKKRVFDMAVSKNTNNTCSQILNNTTKTICNVNRDIIIQGNCTTCSINTKPDLIQNKCM